MVIPASAVRALSIHSVSSEEARLVLLGRNWLIRDSSIQLEMMKYDLQKEALTPPRSPGAIKLLD